MKRFVAIALAGLACGVGAAPVTDLAFSAEGTLAVAGTGEVQLRLPSDPLQTNSVPANLQRVAAVGFGGRDAFLLVGGGTAGESGAAILLDWGTKRVLQRHEDFVDLVTCVAFDREGRWFAVGSADAKAFVGSVEQGGKLIPLAGHTGPVTGVAWSPDGDIVVTGSADCSLKVWSAADGKLLRSLAQHTEAIHAVVFRAGESGHCASAGDDRTVRIWQPKIGRMVRIVRGHGGPVFALTYSPDGTALFSAGKEGVIRQIDPESDRIMGEWKAHAEPIYSLAISADGSVIASGDWAGEVKFWRWSQGRLEPR